MNQEVKTINGYSIKDEKARNDIESLNLNRIKTFDNIQSMKNDTTLLEGMHVKTKGYYESNDGGNGEYIIVDDDTLVDNGGTIHVLSNELRAVLIIENNTILLEQFGAYGDNTHDDSNVINNALSLANTKNYEVVGNKEYLINNTININYDNLNIKFNKINYTGEGYAIYLKGKDNNIRINTLISTGVGFYITCDDNTTTRRNKIDIDIITTEEHGVYFFTDSWGIFENELKFKQITISDNTCYGIYLLSEHSETHQTSYINQNVIYGGRIDGALYSIYANATDGQINELLCYNISCESSTNGLYLEKVTDSSFENFRLEELTNENGHLYMKLVGDTRNNNFRFNRYVPLELIDRTDLTNPYNSPNTIYSNIRDSRQGNLLGTMMKFWGNGPINIIDPVLKSKSITGDTTLGDLEYINLFNVQNSVSTCTIKLNKMYNDNGVNTFYVYKRSDTTSITLTTHDESNSLEITRNGLNQVKFIGSIQIVQ